MFPLNEWDTEYRNLSNEWRNAMLVTMLNQQLYDNLVHSTQKLLKTAKENNIELSNKEDLIKNIEESQSIMDRITEVFHPTTLDKENNRRDLDRTCFSVLSN